MDEDTAHPIGPEDWDQHQPIAVFPLPNAVLFPGAVQPLHVFEPRYKTLVADVIAGKGLMALALLEPGYEASYYGNPPFHSVVCVGSIVAHEKVDQGKYNILLRGLVRGVAEEMVCDAPYRTFRIRQLVEKPCGDRESELRAQLEDMLQQSGFKQMPGYDELIELLGSEMEFGQLVDALAFSLVAEVETKQTLLEEVDDKARCMMVLEQLDVLNQQLQAHRRRSQWPPKLCQN